MRSKDTEKLPDPSEIGLGELDGCVAVEHFNGKTLEEAEALFDGCGISLTYTEDLMWMEPVGFRFYIRAAINYCLSERACGDPYIIAGLATAITFQQDGDSSELSSVSSVLANFCTKVLSQWDRYEVDPVIYADLREKYVQMSEFFSSDASAASSAKD